jgi:hypothetical protein
MDPMNFDLSRKESPDGLLSLPQFTGDVSRRDSQKVAGGGVSLRLTEPPVGPTGDHALEGRKNSLVKP